MQFHYQVLDKNRQLFQGELEAESLKKAHLSLVQQGYEVQLLESVDGKFVKYRLTNFGLVSLKEKMLFVKHLSLMIKSGMVLDESIEALYEQAKGRMRSILRRLLELVRKGSELSDGLKLYPYTFNEFFVNMVRVGEQSGSLEKNLLNLSVKLKKDHDLRSKVQSALMYPAIVVVALLGLGITLSIFILPKFLQLFRSLNVDLPLITQIFIVVAEFSQSYWYLVLIVVIAFAAAMIVMNKLRQTKRLIHWIVYHLPISHQFSKISNLTNFNRSMALMLQGGLTIDEALDIMTRALSSSLYQERVAAMLLEVRKGTALSVVMQKYPKHFPSLVTKMVHVGEISGNLSETFEYLAEFYEDELDSLSKNLSTILEPVLLLVIGVLVAFMALSIILPIGNIISGINR